MPEPPFRLAPLGRWLDPRPEALARAEPFADAANIPFDELPQRLHELPPKDESISICDVIPLGSQSLDYLANGGRKASLVAPRMADDWTQFRLWRPNEFLESVLPRLSGGTSLDLGCGSGRDALLMASYGFNVTACDQLPEALALGRQLAERYLVPPLENARPPIEWTPIDLESSTGLGDRGRFDLITSIRYLHRPLITRIPDLLNENGSFVLETFTELHRQRHGKPSRDEHVLKLGEAPRLVPGLEIAHFDEGWRGDRHTARLWAVRRGVGAFRTEWLPSR